MVDRRWSVELTREGRNGPRRFRLAGRMTAVWLGVGGVVLVGCAFWLGHRTATHTARHQVAELEARIDSLTEENAKVIALAARIQELEGTYRQLRAVMGGDVAPSARDILLPPLPSESNPALSTEPGTPASPGVPTVWPLVEPGFVTRTFGDSVPGEGPHMGLDIAVPVGSYVRATGAGVVSEAEVDPEYGRYVRIEHADGIRSLYAHNSWIFVSSGDSVATGEVIALSGSTGRSTAPHLHLEIEQGGETVDPLPFVSGRL